MRVAIEAASLALTSGGLARYTAELSLALARNFPDDEFNLTSDQEFVMPGEASGARGTTGQEAYPTSLPNLRRGGGPRNALERRWWLWGLARELRRLGADLIHGPDFAVPYVPSRPSVLTLHDLSPWMKDEWHGNAARVRHRTPILLEMGVATMVITPSDRVRKQAMERFHLRPERVVAIPEAAVPWLRPIACERRYFLFVGTIEPRKNLTVLIDAWREVRRECEIELWIAGRTRADAAPIAPEPGLRLLGEVPDERLVELYSGAMGFVYPSHYEGFGLPVLEAMQCGAPVISSKAVYEAAGDAAIYAEDAGEIARAMRELAANAELRAEWSERSLARAREFTWDRTARETYAVYREAMKRFRKHARDNTN